ncbi:MAG: hypothetical protein EOO59_04720 [Hymenobacter sp.]|nr:MAG: hypothetical protein EOO59_04720 [Hymenobacter sp.]
MIRYVATVAILFVALASQAQAPGSGGPTPTPGVPIDGGISVLLASGAAYAVRRLRQRRK